MHICYVIWKFSSPENFQKMGGAENQLLKIVNHLKNNDDIKISIISRKMPNESKKEFPSNNVEITRINSTKIPFLSMIIFSISLFFKLIKLNKKDKIHLIHIPLPDLFLFSIWFIRIFLKIPFISRIAADELNPINSKGLWKMERLFVRSLILRSNAIQTLNQNATQQAFDLSFSKERIFLIPNGIAPPTISRDYKKLSNEIIYIGAMRIQPRKLRIEQKNLEFLINAFNSVLTRKSDLKLIMVGDGNYKSHLVDLVSKLNIENRVFFKGYQTNVNLYLENADIFVNPSHFEGMPNTVLEAMAMGVFTLCSNIPEHQFLIQNTITGVLFDHHNHLDFVQKIIDFYENPKNYIDMAKKGQEIIIKNHSIDIIIQQLNEMYNKVIISSKKIKAKES
ncbi:MAG: glycosyltransferase [Candidatus Thorarchaeota archaeon]